MSIAPAIPSADDELTRLALASELDAPLPADAVPWDPRADAGDTTLPHWYMPAPMVGASRISRWRRAAGWAIVAGSLAVVASGLCNTYGYLVVA